jgi:4-hydroxy-tetrahydrodipicolinate reductase
MLKIIVSGVLGKMGSSIVQVLDKEPTIQLVAGIERKGHPLIGRDVSEILGGGKAPIVDTLEDIIEKADCLVEFSNPEATVTHLEIASSARTPCVVGTTGFTKSQMRGIKKLSSAISCVLSPNMSRGVNLMFNLIKEISALLKDYDCEIVEAHHREKKDSPSGTALKLAEIIGETRKKRLSGLVKYGRVGSETRTGEEIGIHSIRAGEIFGKHTVLWAGGGEKIAISHEALSRQAFAYGTISAVKWVVNRAPGLYTMKDVLGL